jgi:hypothetical protein
MLGALLAALGVLQMLSGRWDGLWLMIVGWFLIGAAGAERSRAALSGLHVGDVMTRKPDLAPGWWTVDAFVGHLLSDTGPRHRAFPVVDLDGRPVGVVTLADLAQVPPTARHNTTTWRTRCPVTGSCRCRTTRPLTPLDPSPAERRDLGGPSRPRLRGGSDRTSDHGRC